MPLRCVIGRRALVCSVAWRKAGRSCNGCLNWFRTSPIARARRHIEFDMNNVFKTPGVADLLYEGLRRSGVPE